MYVSKVFVNLSNGSGNLKAFCNVILSQDGSKLPCLQLDGFKISNGKNGLFVGLPSQKGKDDNYYDTVKFSKGKDGKMNSESEAFYQLVTTAIMQEYNKVSGTKTEPKPNDSKASTTTDDEDDW